MGRFFCFLLFVLVNLAIPTEAAPYQRPTGNCYSRGQMNELISWCHANRQIPVPKAYICTDDENVIYGVTVAAHNNKAKIRLEGKPFSPVKLACAELCGWDPYLPRTVANYAFLDEGAEDVDSVIYCHCPSITAYRSFSPPTPSELREEAYRYHNWSDLAEADRECSGRRVDVDVDKHNARLIGKRCSDTTPGLRLECGDGTIDHCSAYPYPEAIGAMPWIHRCEAYPSP